MCYNNERKKHIKSSLVGSAYENRSEQMKILYGSYNKKGGIRNGSSCNETITRSRCSLWTSNKKMGSKNGRIHIPSQNGIHIIDLQKASKKIDEAYEFIKEQVEEGKTVLFVGTKNKLKIA